MSLETGDFLDDLDADNPVTATDPVSDGSDHLRLIKKVLLATFGQMAALWSLAANNVAIKMSNVAADGFVDMIKVNASDEVVVGDGSADIILDGEVTDGLVFADNNSPLSMRNAADDAVIDMIKVNADDNIEIGGTASRTEFPTGFNSGLNIGAEVDSNARGDNVLKRGSITLPHFANASPVIAILRMLSNGSDNILRIGGINSSLSAATIIELRTTPDHDDESAGAIGLKVDSDSNVTIPAGDLVVTGKIGTGSNGELTIASGAITVTSTRHAVDTEGNNSTDNLDNINGGDAGDWLMLNAASSSRTIVVRDASIGGGNIALAGDASFSMINIRDRIFLVWSGTLWCEISRSQN